MTYFKPNEGARSAKEWEELGIEGGGTRRNIDFKALNEAALEHVGEVLNHWVPGGKESGSNYIVLNPKRDDGTPGSFSISVEKGIWKDFALQDVGGNDLISLVAYIEGVSQYAAAEMLEEFLESLSKTKSALYSASPRKSGKVKADPAWAAVLPVPNHTPAAPSQHYKLGTPTRIWTYRDEAGQLLGYVYRFDLQNGQKEYRPLTYCHDRAGQEGWVWQGFPSPRPMYGLEKLRVKPDAAVLICEGEKATDAAQSMFPDLVCMSWPGGSQAVKEVNWSPIASRKIFLWPDHDVAGFKAMESIANYLQQSNPKINISVLNIPEGKPKGWDCADALAEGLSANDVPLELFEAYKSEVPIGDEYVLKSDGVYQIRYGKDNSPIHTRISSRIDVVALTRNEQNQSWGLLLNFKDRDGHVHEYAMPRELLSGYGDLYKQELLKRGADVMPGCKDALSGYFITANPKERVLCVDSSGWHGDVFVLPHKTFGKSNERVILQTVDLGRIMPFGSAGSLEDWKREVAAKCAGNSRLILALCVALAGPFLEPVGQENGGFHLRGPSSSGKTKALSVAGSVWGNRRMVRTWRTTGNAIESLAMDHNDSVLILDELGQVAADEAGEIAYSLANGQSKSRANRFGNAKPSYSWRMLFLSTGEVGLADHVAAAGDQIKAGQEVRFLDIPSDAGTGLGVFDTIHGAASPQQFADDLHVKSESYYGIAAESLLKRLTSDPAELARAATKVKATQKQFVDQFVPNDSNGQVFRAAGRFGMIAGVGEYCAEIGILPWTQGEALAGIGKCFADWLDSRGSNQAMEEVRAVAQIRRFLELHGESRFTPLGIEGVGEPDHPRTINRVGFRNIIEGGLFEYWVLPDVYKSELCRGLDSHLVTRTLKAMGLLALDSHGKSTVGKRLPGFANTTRVYVIKPEIFNR